MNLREVREHYRLRRLARSEYGQTIWTDLRDLWGKHRPRSGLNGRQRAYFEGISRGREETRAELAQQGNSVPARDAYRDGFENGYRDAIRLAEYIVQCPLDDIEQYIENIDIRGRNSFVDDVRASVDAAKRTFDSARSEWSIRYEADHGTAHKGQDH